MKQFRLFFSMVMMAVPVRKYAGVRLRAIRFVVERETAQTDS